MLLLIEPIVAIISEKDLRLGDMLAKTQVIKEQYFIEDTKNGQITNNQQIA